MVALVVQRISTRKVTINSLSPVKLVKHGIRGLQGAKGDKGLQWRGDWNSSTNYVIDDLVNRNGKLYIAIAANNNSEPPSANWELFFESAGETWLENTSDLSLSNTHSGFIFSNRGASGEVIYTLNPSGITPGKKFGFAIIEDQQVKIQLAGGGIIALGDGEQASDYMSCTKKGGFLLLQVSDNINIIKPGVTGSWEYA